MLSFLDPLRVITSDNAALVALVRLSIAAFCGGCIGLERGKKRRPAGFRTHMLVCLAAALAMIMSQYLTMMINEYWLEMIGELNSPGSISTDVSRFGAQIINGIGFLGAGTVIVTGRQQVKGLTTAAGLWASACMGLCIGAGFVEGAFVACVLIILTIIVFSHLERFIVSRVRNINLYIEFAHADDVGAIISAIKAQDIRIFDVEIQKSKEQGGNQSAVFSVLLPKRMSHATALSVVAGVENVRAIEEL